VSTAADSAIADEIGTWRRRRLESAAAPPPPTGRGARRITVGDHEVLVVRRHRESARPRLGRS
jgi:hypothetical protein